MAKYHINGKGEPGLCRARKTCPFGSAEDHYPSREAAQQAFELEQESSFGKAVDHAPRANWRVLRPTEEHAVYTNYRRTLRSIRSTPTKDSAAETKQRALKATADRYRVPVSQVKSIAALGMEAEGVSGVREDPKHLAQLAYMAEAKRLLLNAKTNDAGELVCHCGSSENVKIRTDPFQAEIHEVHEPMLTCSDCYTRVAEDI